VYCFFYTFGDIYTNMSDLTLKAIPEDVRKIVLKQQLKEKEDRGINQFSMSTTIYKIIREWEKCYNSQKEKR
jgi:hypothetical protein